MNPLPKLSSILTLALGGLVFTTVACNDMEGEQRKADIKVRDAVKSSVKSRQNPTTKEFDKEWNNAVTQLNNAVNEKKASPTQRIRANSLLGEAEFEAGDRVVRDLNRLDPQIAATLWDIQQVANQIQAVNDSVKALTATDPAATLKAIETNRATAAAASAAAAQKAGELQTKIQGVKGEIAKLIQQKDATIAEADATADKASKATLKEAEPMLDSVTESRRKAGNIGHDIDKVTATLLPLERDLASEEAKKKSADDAVAALDASKKNTDTNWATVQTQIQAQKTLAGTLGEQLSAKAKTLDDLNKQASTLRAKALEQFDKSAKHNGTASNDAKTLAGTLDSWSRSDKFSTAAETKTWVQLRQIYNLNVFKLLEADANNAQGDIHSTAAAQLGAQQKLATGIAKSLQEAGITLPATLGTDTDQKKELEAASKAYTLASDQFSSVYGAPGGYPKELKESAQISRMFSLYSQYMNGDTTKLGEAKKLFSEIFESKKTDPAIQAFPADLRG